MRVSDRLLPSFVILKYIYKKDLMVFNESKYLLLISIVVNNTY